MSILSAPSLGLSLVSATSPSIRWVFVRQRFEQMLKNLEITLDQAEDGERKYRGVLGTLNRAYYGSWNPTANGILAGSWGKSTRVRPPRDIDLLFALPVDLFYQFDQRLGNKQSQLLQDVAEVLRNTYSQTRIRADGQVVVVGFNTYQIEVAPAFYYQPGGNLICDTNDGGRWKHIDPGAEVATLETSDYWHNGNARKLTRILKQWQRHCDVPIKSFFIEAMVKELLPKKIYGANHEWWFDWLVRDAFEHMIGRANGGFFMPGCAQEWIDIGDAWLSKTQTAYSRALRACAYEYNNEDLLAGIEWQKIFGSMIPQTTGRVGFGLR